MTTGLILLLIAGVLVLLGVGQRVLDKLRLNDRQALLWIALILAGGLIPEIPITNRFRFNIGGALIPLALSVYLLDQSRFRPRTRAQLMPRRRLVPAQSFMRSGGSCRMSRRIFKLTRW